MREFFYKMRPKEKCPPRITAKKIWWSWLGAFLGIYLIGSIGSACGFSEKGTLFLLGSFGASAVLVYGAPLAAFSQPRNLLGGHVVSALIGVTVYIFLGKHPVLGGAIAVSLSIVSMHYTQTLHPPGGATALLAVIGGDGIHSLGYRYVLSPVLSGAVILLLVALLINNLSSNPKRHYPIYWF